MTQTPDKNRTWSISQLAAEFDLSTRTVRFYEEKGLLAPGRTRGGHRFYTRRDRARLKLILRGKRFGHSLEEIADMIGLASEGMSESDQIRRTLEYGEKNLVEIRRRMEEMRVMEREIISLKARLVKRLAEIGGS